MRGSEEDVLQPRIHDTISIDRQKKLQEVCYRDYRLVVPRVLNGDGVELGHSLADIMKKQPFKMRLLRLEKPFSMYLLNEILGDSFISAAHCLRDGLCTRLRRGETSFVQGYV